MAQKKRNVTKQHKEAMAAGRQAARAVNAYLTALESNRPRRGRKVSVDTLEARLVDAQAKAESSAGTAKLLALQDAADLEARIADAAKPEAVDLPALEAAFVEHAKTYGESKGIAYSTWRSAGVPAAVLAEAKIGRGRQ